MENIVTCGLIEKHPITCLGLQILIAQHFQGATIHTGGELSDFPTDSRSQPFDVIVIGLHSKDQENWFNMIQECKREYHRASLIVLMEMVESSTILKFLRMGVSGVLLKENEPAEFLECMDTIRNGGRYLGTQVEEMIISHAVENCELPRFPNDRRKTTTNRLTQHQSFIADCLVKGMKTSEIAMELNLASSTVSTIKATILRKMNVKNVFELAGAEIYENYRKVV